MNMGLFDNLKIPDLAQWGERITVFINAANGKLEAQTEAIRTLANFVRQLSDDLQKQRAILARIEKRLDYDRYGRSNTYDNPPAIDGLVNGAAADHEGFPGGAGPGVKPDMAGESYAAEIDGHEAA